ncbi:cobalamin biosynthesis protein [Mycolicibacterium fortuitum subsp. fortuitum DSM 46621 = ATCC 6841 = JCM 6387]|uniref:Cobalamin biosynthesis protein CobD n=1 Tax=Mycolicibacterium fortuitum subsp. fortuitum DSM 46621 = ATCC 6841 = JCM 6387 TaxID=1214102 RepID=K0VFY8_MYCFO|nr:Adenosylcobinamide-phosphate synthase [Mycobacterium sp. VKM Ac-1817D]EJZ13793.1 cobalamin biosynthesis protein [Mycolicibacterium fortuitum subsp. fortuitum DSM 46621 = ATCC 6841 = JCM 6387]CRL55754.1 cobalamin biosynthesis protein [Mycolicibacterium fortuitum subsp. fortuitum DSM 46621 = ATCC 6841 = JCM 6387]CRL77397.1 cobalamin biosynthesis protein [Mycolicibacter nonchromogenicus]
MAGFGTGAARLETHTYADSRGAGALHTGLLLGGLAGLGWVAGRGDRIWVTAAATYVALGGTSLNRVGHQMSRLLTTDDVAGARRLLPSLCGRDPAALDASGLTRATVESLAENTSDAQVAPLFWAAIGGVPGVLVYRGANTLDAMIGHRSPRYHHFGWAAARFDDLLNYVPARLTGVLAVLCAPVVGGSPVAALRAWRRDAARHPSPNAGVAEASFAGALGVRLGGPTQYAHQLEIRPTLGDGRIPEVADVARAVRLSRAVQAAAAAVAVLLAVSVASRSGRRSSPRW